MTVHDVAPARPLRKDAARNRELLIESARVVFARRGLEASLDEIAHQAGLGVGTAYRHFANKYELATALMQQTIDTIVGSAEAALDASDPWQGLVGFLEAALAAQTADRGLREVLMGVHDPAKMDQVHDRLIGPISELLARAQRAGVVRADADATDLGFVIGMLCTVADMAAGSPQLWRRYLSILLDGLRPGGTPFTTPPLNELEFRTAMAAHKQLLTRAAGSDAPAGRDCDPA